MSGLPKKCCSSCYYSYQNYIDDMNEMIETLIHQTQNQPEEYEKHFTAYLTRLQKTQEYIEKNRIVIERILNEYKQSYLLKHCQFMKEINEKNNSINEIKETEIIDTDCCEVPHNHQTYMIDNILQQIVREWTESGETIRKATFEYFYKTVGTNKRIFIPGCGLGRLAFELQKRGNECYACECSHYMLMALNMISQLNKDEIEMYPYLNETSDLINSNELFVSHKFPNVDPSLLNAIDFSESPFEEYCNECVIQFDCVCTLYFIDTAYNIVDYIKGIKKVLKEGGLWINLGPLHWVHDKYDSFHFSLNEIFDICEEVGFTIEHKEFINDTLYIPTSNSTCPLTYKNMFFVLRNGKK